MPVVLFKKSEEEVEKVLRMKDTVPGGNVTTTAEPTVNVLVLLPFYRICFFEIVFPWFDDDWTDYNREDGDSPSTASTGVSSAGGITLKTVDEKKMEWE